MFSISESTIRNLIQFAIDEPGPKSHTITRKFMYERLTGLLAAFDSPQSHCLSISHSENLAQILGLRQSTIVAANYPN
jgi:hypothetical protein